MIKKALVWAYGDTVRYVAFLFAVAALVAFLQVLIVYPVQVVLTALVGFAVYALFCLATEWR